MKIKTSELAGAALDWVVAKCEGITLDEYGSIPDPTTPEWDRTERFIDFVPSTNWAQCGPIIDREGISTIRCDDEYGVDSQGFCNNQRIPVWCAVRGQHGTTTFTEHQSHEAMFQIVESEVMYGPTPHIAAMRCFVASKLGAEVDVPQELVVSSRNDEHTEETDDQAGAERP